ncbi:hypothetical protein ALC56_03087 [Trachymyrmex septentrionalis]|uniref:Uncharacterized protein n=1 Tax=Trachymyrmex septentrionalis TaxID=34720 RepID=A0A195FQ39_9HYME|nr:hypothetical protein ALC56_03087 [Trachymyrmex septentrionalis]
MPLRMTTGTPVRNTIGSHMISRVRCAIARMKEISHKGAYLPLSGLEGLPVNRATILSKRGQYPGSAAAGDSFRHETLHMLSHHGAVRAHRVETRPPSRPLSSGFARAPRYVYVRVRSVFTQRVGTMRCGAVRCVRSRGSNLALDAVAAQCRHVFSYSLTADGLLPTRPLGRVRSLLDDTKINFFFYHYDSALRLYIRKQRRREGTLNCTRMRMERIHKKIRLLSFLLQGILSRILRSQHSRGRCAQREKDLTDYLEHDSPMLRTVLLLGRLLLETPSLGIHTLEPDWLRRSVEFNSATRESPVIRAFKRRDS